MKPIEKACISLASNNVYQRVTSSNNLFSKLNFVLLLSQVLIVSTNKNLLWNVIQKRVLSHPFNIQTSPIIRLYFDPFNRRRLLCTNVKFYFYSCSVISSLLFVCKTRRKHLYIISTKTYFFFRQSLSLQ